MNSQVCIEAYAGGPLPLRMPVKVGGRPAHICGRALGVERYDVVFQDHCIVADLPRNRLEPDWSELRK